MMFDLLIIFLCVTVIWMALVSAAWVSNRVGTAPGVVTPILGLITLIIFILWLVTEYGGGIGVD